MKSTDSLHALTSTPFIARLRLNGAAGFFEPLIGYTRHIYTRHCACEEYVARIEEAVDAIVRVRPVATEPR